MTKAVVGAGTESRRGGRGVKSIPLDVSDALYIEGKKTHHPDFCRGGAAMEERVTGRSRGLGLMSVILAGGCRNCV